MKYRTKRQKECLALSRLFSTLAVGVALPFAPAHATFVGTGGEVTMDGEYMVHTFTNATDTFTVTGSGEVEVLLVGGGGGGGAYGGGGGGGGQVVSNRVMLTSRPYEIRVGAGGRGANASGSTPTVNYQADAGGDTEAFDLVAKGGGAGGSTRAGYSGANGGGGGVATYKTTPESDITKNGGAPIDPSVGFYGGKSLQPAGLSHFYQAAGGGGGAGGDGGDATRDTSVTTGDMGVASGHGGRGVTNAITGVALGYGGGGGGGCSKAARGRGSDGGGNGGDGRSSTTVESGRSGDDGFGGGGGGGGRSARVSGDGGKGGCGVVIVRYKPVYPEYFEQVEVTGNYSYKHKKNRWC